MSSEHFPDEDMDELLSQLRAAIAETGLGDDDRGRLDDLVRRIESQADEDEDDDPNIFEHLDDALSRFEAEHTGLVHTINRIANALSAGGI
ncbi:MAG: DUF4404 family protein [Acidimicrobiales bacterium]